MTGTPGGPDRTDSASFAPVRLDRQARRTWSRTAAFALLPLALVAAGVIGRLTTSPVTEGDGVTAVPVATALGQGASGLAGAAIPTPRAPRTGPDAARIALAVAPTGSAINVHGDVGGLDVAWIFVTLENEDGSIARAGARLVVRAVAETGRPGRTVFDVRIPVPDAVDITDLWVKADAYDALGYTVATRRLAVGPRAPGAATEVL